jgi:anti-sigma regulatory factor (Ser/Thr protein kinase)
MPVRLHAWADTLPSFAAEVVSQSDVARPNVYTEFAARPGQIRIARWQITEWVHRVGFSAADGRDVVLASDEAISNAVEHAYPGTTGTLTLFAACTRVASAVRVIVADHGLWRPPPADPGSRGRGLSMMEKLADVFRLVHGPRGTTVVLGWPLPA